MQIQQGRVFKQGLSREIGTSMKQFKLFILIVQLVFFVPIVAAKPFYDYCMAPQSDAQRQTVLAVMIKMKVQDRPNQENCQLAADRLLERWFLNIYPDPFDPARGPASDLAPLDDQFQLKNLSVAKNDIQDLQPLRRLKNLTQLNVNFNPLSDISPVANFKLLEEFFATETQVTDLKPLAGLQRLRVLSLSSNGIVDIDSLARLTNLKALYLSNNQISDATAVGKMSLEYLHLPGNQLRYLDISSSAETMILLDVAKNDLTDVAGIDRLTRVDAITISENEFSDLRSFSGLKTLRWLDVSKNKITDLSPLSGLKDLEHLLMAGNGICSIPPEVAELQDEHLNSKGEWIRLKISGSRDQPFCSGSSRF